MISSPVLFRKIHGNDLWKALYSGRYLVIFHNFPHHSIFTYSPTVDILVRNSFNWFGNLFFLGSYIIGNVFWLQILRVILPLFAVILYHSLVDYDTNPVYVLLFVTFLYGTSQKMILRTAIFSIPMTGLVFWCWHKIKNQARHLWLYALPVILLVWSNLHGSYLVGWGFCVIFITGIVLENIRNVDFEWNLITRAILLITVSSFLVIFVKPFPDYSLSNRLSQIFSVSKKKNSAKTIGTKVPTKRQKKTTTRQTQSSYYTTFKTLLQRSIFPPKNFRSNEFRFPPENLQFLFVSSSWVLGFLLIMSLIVGRGQTITDWLLLGTGLLLALSYLRTVAYLPLIALPILLRQSKQKPIHNWLSSSKTTIISIVLIFMMIGSVSSLIMTGSVNSLTGISSHEIGYGTISRFDNKYVENLLRKYPDERIANSYNMGSFLIWKWWPHKKVLIDSKSSAYRDIFWKKLTRTNVTASLLEAKIYYFLTEWSNISVEDTLLPDPEWKIDVKSDSLVLFKHRKSLR